MSTEVLRGLRSSAPCTDILSWKEPHADFCDFCAERRRVGSDVLQTRRIAGNGQRGNPLIVRSCFLAHDPCKGSSNAPSRTSTRSGDIGYCSMQYKFAASCADAVKTYARDGGRVRRAFKTISQVLRRYAEAGELVWLATQGITGPDLPSSEVEQR